MIVGLSSFRVRPFHLTTVRHLQNYLICELCYRRRSVFFVIEVMFRLSQNFLFCFRPLIFVKMCIISGEWQFFRSSSLDCRVLIITNFKLINDRRLYKSSNIQLSLSEMYNCFKKKIS